MAAGVVRVAAIADLHCSKTSQGAFQPLFARLSESADVVLIAGDLTDYGLPEEATVLAKEPDGAAHSCRCRPRQSRCGIGESRRRPPDPGRRRPRRARRRNMRAARRRHRGREGFGGGFGCRALGPWGETIIKQFVHEAVDEALKLEAALARLRTTQLVALLHYAPVQETVEGEPLEIYPFLGSSRLEDPIGRYPVSFVLHGHAHRGQLEGRTKTGVPVYNVSMPLLTRTFADRLPFRVFELPVDDVAHAQPVPAPARGRRATDALAS